MKTGVVVLGSTGSVGETALRVLRQHADRFEVVGLAAGRRVERLAEQIREFSPQAVSVGREEDARALGEAFPGLEVHSGPGGPVALVERPSSRTVIAAIVGARGLAATYRAVQLGRRVALANKEALVMAGGLMMDAARRSGAELLPVDSEHCAVFQCLKGESVRHVRRILLTASGGALREHPLDALASATVEQVLAHPTWKMGPKITVDSATMMNKGLEVIEAHHLFATPLERIDVLLHPQSLVHSLVEFEDGSVLAQLATTDMALPVQYALTYPARLPGVLERLDLATSPPLCFSEPDPVRYPCLGLARHAAARSGAHAVALNAANEVAVQAFLDERLTYGAIPGLIEDVLAATDAAAPASLEEVYEVDAASRRMAVEVAARVGDRP